MQRNIAIQFPDLTEVFYLPDSHTGFGFKLSIKYITTEFICSVRALYMSEPAIDLGFKPVSCMNNWYHVHQGEWRRMILYWMKNPYWSGKPQKACRLQWCLNAHEKEPIPYVVTRKSEDAFLAGSGCGFYIHDKIEPRYFKRFFTLLRLPLKVKPIQDRWLKKNHYRLLDTGSLATYWINGWKPEEYDPDIERKFFNVDKSWRAL